MAQITMTFTIIKLPPFGLTSRTVRERLEEHGRRVPGPCPPFNKPVPIPDEEARKVIEQMAEGAIKPKPKFFFEEGDEVRVIDGPFSNFNGVVEEVKPDKGKIKVLISIFGRATPVELDFVQVAKL